MIRRFNELYQARIIEYSKHPFHEGDLKNATHVLEAYNPLCGDKYSLYLHIHEDTVLAASFKGYGCAISKASSSVLIKKSIGRTLDEISEIISLFGKIIDPESKSSPEELSEDPDLLAFSATRQFPERKKCASLSWDEMEIIVNRKE